MSANGRGCVETRWPEIAGNGFIQRLARRKSVSEGPQPRIRPIASIIFGIPTMLSTLFRL